MKKLLRETDNRETNAVAEAGNPEAAQAVSSAQSPIPSQPAPSESPAERRNFHE